MGFGNTLYYVVVFTVSLFLLLNYSPFLQDTEWQAYSPELLRFEGPLGINHDLDKSTLILRDQAVGPESLEYKNGGIYASLENGKVVFIQNDKIMKTVVDTSKDSGVRGRPLGLRFFKEHLYIADGYRGLLKANVNTGEISVLLPGLDTVNGVRLVFADDLDIDDDGIIYISDASTKWGMDNVIQILLEHENSGRVYRYDTRTGRTDVLVDNLFFPNGIQLAHDKKSLLIAEFANHRILKYHLKGPQKGLTEVFAKLPGEPDNIRPSASGGYWVAFLSTRNSSSPHLIDRLAPHPKFRKALSLLSHATATGLQWINNFLSLSVLETVSTELKNGGYFKMLWNWNHSVLVELDVKGNIVRSLHSDNAQLSSLSQVLEHNGHLYLGSFVNPYIVKVKL